MQAATPYPLTVHRSTGSRKRFRLRLLVGTIFAVPLLAACNLTPRLQTSADGQAPPHTQSSIVITNAGGGTLEWQANFDNPYLELRTSLGISVSGGTLGSGQSARLYIRVDGRLAHPTTGVNATLAISSNGGSRSLPINVGAAAACLATSTTPSQPVAVGNEILVSYNLRGGAFRDWIGTQSGNHGEAAYNSQGGGQVGPQSGTPDESRPGSPIEAQLTTQELSALAAQARTEISAQLGLTTIEAGNGIVPDLLVAPATANVDDLIAALQSDPRVAAVQRNYYVYLQQYPLPPTDPFYTGQWSLTSFGVPEAWAHLAGTALRQVVLAVIDSGVDSAHPDLFSKMLPGYDFFRNSELADPVNVTPDNRFHGKVSHGTHVAGIAAALANDIGVVGVAYQSEVRILPIKVFDDCGDVGSIFALAKGIYWAAGFDVPGAPTNPTPANIINLSLGASGQHPVLDQATTAAFAANVLVVAAAGNHTSSSPAPVLSPANGPDVLAVGSVNQDRQLSAFSNQGPQVDVVAPGGSGEPTSDPDLLCGVGPGQPKVISTVPYMPGAPLQFGYGCMFGTSMAAPFVAGVAALVMLQDATASAHDVFNLLKSTAVREPHMMNENMYGVGLVCADAALGAATRCGAP